MVSINQNLVGSIVQREVERLVCFLVCASATHFQRDVGTETCSTLTQVIIFRLRVAVRGQVAVMAAFYSAANLHIISNLHSTGNVISYTVKTTQRGH